MKITYRKTKEFDNDSFQEFGIYPFTNENIAGYIKPVVEAAGGGKRVLTVAASGDHSINAVCNGAQIITEFDRNKPSLYYSELKKVALCYLDFEEFKSFFSKSNDPFINSLTQLWRSGVYRSIRKGLSDECRNFWDETLSKKREFKRDTPLGSYRLYQETFPYKNNLGNQNEYLNSKENYKKTQINMAGIKVNFMHTLIQNLTDELGEQKFDYALFSNIFSYYNQHRDGTSYNNSTFEKEVSIPLLKHCNVIQSRYYYYFDADEEKETISKIKKLGVKAKPYCVESHKNGILMISNK